MTTLTAKHLAEAIAVLERVEHLIGPIDPINLARLRVDAMMARISLTIHGLDGVKIEVKEAAQ